jgi:cytochrome bd-type quinol oxidase subunit 2
MSAHAPLQVAQHGAPRERRGAWSGLVVGPVAWGVHHQVGSDLVYYDCTRYGPGLVLALGIACALVALGGAWLSWRVRAPADSNASASLRFGALISALGALLFAVVIVAQAVAGLFFGGCEQ